MIQLSMNELTTMRWSLEEDIEEFSQAGFDGVGIWRQKLSDVGEDLATDLLAKKGLKCSNLLWAGGFTGSDGISFRDSVVDAVEAIRSAGRLGADCLVIYSGAWGGHTRTHAQRLVQNALRELLPFAEEFGVALSLEPMHPGCGADWTFLETPREVLELIDPLENPFLKIAIDAYHVGFECLEDESQLDYLAEIANRVGIVHLGDGYESPDGEQNRCPLGKGCLPIDSIIKTLVGAGYDGFFDVELIGESVEQIDYPTLIQQSRDYLGERFAATG